MQSLKKLCLLLCLLASTACTTPPPVIKVVPQVQTEKPAEVLFTLCKRPPETEWKVTGDILVTLDAWKLAFEKCAKSMDVLHKWHFGEPSVVKP